MDLRALLDPWDPWDPWDLRDLRDSGAWLDLLDSGGFKEYRALLDQPDFEALLEPSDLPDQRA